MVGFDGEPPRSGARTLHLDLTDVAAHASSCASLTGIQRVQIECARVLLADRDAQAAAFAEFRGARVDLRPLFADPKLAGVEAIFAQMRRMFGPARSLGGSGLARKLGSAAAALRGALAPAGRRFGPSDRLYVGGAFWAWPQSVKTYEQAARDGADVVVLVHDVLPLTRPDLADSGCRPLFERMLRLKARTITVSQHSRAEIERARRALGAPDDLAPPTVVPLAHAFSAAPRNFVAEAPPTRRLAALAADGAFALCVGTIEARKNQRPLMGLWRRLAREAGPGWPRLVLAGKPGWRAEETVRLLKRADPAGPCVWIEAPSDAELAWLYGRSLFTVFPSLAEGWGLPIGESLWFGKPCVASNATSAPEVGGPLCAYADPNAIDSFAEPIVRLVRDADFYRRSVAAIRATRLRGWSETAEALVEALASYERSEPSPAARRGARAGAFDRPSSDRLAPEMG